MQHQSFEFLAVELCFSKAPTKRQTSPNGDGLCPKMVKRSFLLKNARHVHLRGMKPDLAFQTQSNQLMVVILLIPFYERDFFWRIGRKSIKHNSAQRQKQKKDSCQIFWVFFLTELTFNLVNNGRRYNWFSGKYKCRREPVHGYGIVTFFQWESKCTKWFLYISLRKKEMNTIAWARQKVTDNLFNYKFFYEKNQVWNKLQHLPIHAYRWEDPTKSYKCFLYADHVTLETSCVCKKKKKSAVRSHATLRPRQKDKKPLDFLSTTLKCAHGFFWISNKSQIRQFDSLWISGWSGA